MRALTPIVFGFLTCLDHLAAASEFETPLLGASAPCHYLVPSVENGGDLLGDTWRGIDSPSNIAQWSLGQVGIGFDTGGELPFYEHVWHDVSLEMYQQNASLFVRIPFELQAGTILSMQQLQLRMRYDDGFVAWINGVEVARANAPATEALAWQSEATAIHPPAEVLQAEVFDITEFASAMREGSNFLTVHALNGTPGNQDFLMSPQLVSVSQDTILLEQGSPCEVLVPSEENGGAALGDSWRRIDQPENFLQWRTGVLGVGYASPPDDIYHQFIGTDLLEEMRYFTASAFVRVPFEIADEAQLAGLRSLWLRLRFDDGLVMWLNGTEVLRINAPEELDWQSSASAAHADSSAVIPTEYDLSDHVGALRVGTNVLAIHGLNNSVGSQDFLLSPELVADPRPPTAFRDAAYMTTLKVEYLPDYLGGPGMGVTYGVATGRRYLFESSEDLINWGGVVRFLASREDQFRRTLFTPIRRGASRTYYRLREE